MLGPTAATIFATPSRRRAPKSSQDSPLGIASQRSSLKTWAMIGSPRPWRIRYSPPSKSPRKTSRSSWIATGSTPVAATSGAAVSWVRRRVVVKMPPIASPRSRSHAAAAWPTPVGLESAGSEWPSKSGNVAPTTAASEAPWRTRTISVEPGGSS